MSYIINIGHFYFSLAEFDFCLSQPYTKPILICSLEEELYEYT